MSSLENRQYLDFEKPIKDLYDQVLQLRETAATTGADLSKAIEELESKAFEARKELTDTLTPWKRVQLSRHPERPYTLKIGRARV